MKTKLLAICFIIFLGACSSKPVYENSRAIKNSEIFRYNFDEVWRATQIALQQYPIRVNNTDRGIIETDFIRVGEVWAPPEHKNISTIKYKLTVRAIKGQVQARPAIKVTISKSSRKYKNFFQGSTDVKGDHLEEAALLYRIKRELTIEHALNKLQKKL